MVHAVILSHLMSSYLSAAGSRVRKSASFFYKPFQIYLSIVTLILTLALLYSTARGPLHTVTKAAVCSLNRVITSSSMGDFKNETRLSPVVIVPGTGGNQLEAKLTGEYEARRPWCYNFRKDYFRLWLDVTTLFPPFTSCFADRLSLNYNPESDQYSNIKGVETRVPYFGTTEGMEYLDPSLK